MAATQGTDSFAALAPVSWHDPAVGRQSSQLQELSNCQTGNGNLQTFTCSFHIVNRRCKNPEVFLFDIQI